MIETIGRYISVLIGVFVLSTFGAMAQSTPTEISTYDTRYDEELPAQSNYELFVSGRNPRAAYEQLRNGYIPVGYAFHGRRDVRVTVADIDLADGIVPASVSAVGLRLRLAGLPADTLSAGEGELFGRRNYALDPFEGRQRVRRLGAVAMAGTWSGGVNGRFADVTPRGCRYDVRFRSGFGPSIYGAGMESYGGFISTTVRTGGLSFLFAAAPSVRGVRVASTDEAFALAGRTLYNPAVGRDLGRWRNAHLRREFVPVAVISYTSPVARNARLNVSLMGRYGAVSRSGLDWYNGISPYPDYYRSLPSGVESEWAADRLRELWWADVPEVMGIDWGALREINRRGGYAQYVVSSRVERVATVAGRVGISGRRDEWFYNVGVRVRWDNSAMYKRIDDLLDSPYALNIDFYESELSMGQVVFNDAANAGAQLSVGDRTDYNYVITRASAVLDGRAFRRWGEWHLAVDFRCGVQGLSRTGRWQKSSHTEGYGPSALHLLADCAVEVAARRVWDSHSVGLKGWAVTRPAEYRNLYLSPESSADISSTHPESSFDNGLRVDYRFESARFKVLAALHAGRTTKLTEVIRYYDDIEALYTDMVVSDLATYRVGVDLSVEWEVNGWCSFSAASSWLRECYERNPSVALYRDIDGTRYADGHTSALAGLHRGSTPELIALCKVSCRANRGWRFETSLTGLGLRFVEPNPLYRMERVRVQAASPEVYNQMRSQKRLGNALCVGANISKSFERSGLMISLSVNGIVAGDRTNYAYEQMRLRHTDEGYTAAPVKRLYSMPATATLSISYAL